MTRDRYTQTILETVSVYLRSTTHMTGPIPLFSISLPYCTVMDLLNILQKMGADGELLRKEYYEKTKVICPLQWSVHFQIVGWVEGRNPTYKIRVDTILTLERLPTQMNTISVFNVVLDCPLFFYLVLSQELFDSS